MTRNLLKISDLSGPELESILDAAELTSLPRVLQGSGVALIFEHPSARTRNAAEMAVVQLGGHPVTIRGEDIGLGRRESVEDVACTLASYHVLIGARVANHDTLKGLVDGLSQNRFAVPVVNLLSDLEHPSQALADLLTIRQHFGRLSGRSIAFIGDSNNVCRSLVNALAMVGANARVASPPGFELSDEDLDYANGLGPGSVERFRRPEDAAEGADVLYADVWVSMGEETDAAAKRKAFTGYSIDEELVSVASEEAIVMHCLPAHRGEEISASVFASPRSRIWEQAENRMHVMRGLFGFLFQMKPAALGADRHGRRNADRDRR